MELEDILYGAFVAKDSRFDGRFFVGISSTGIYCRPVCWAKPAKRENCTFFHTAAEAELAGYRPCLLCRPELAPGNALVDAKSSLASKAVRFLEENCGTSEKIEYFAAKLGCTERHLRRVFLEEYHVPPVRYLQTCRLLLAKNLLTDTNLSVLDVAMAAGFGSLRRMNALFQKQYNLSPTALRKRTDNGESKNGTIAVNLCYRPPYRWKEILEFLASRHIAGVEKVENGQYFRTVHMTDIKGILHTGWIKISHNYEKNALKVTISDTLIPVISQVIARVKCLFDLYCDPAAVYEKLRIMNELQCDLCQFGRRVPGCFDPFETAVRAILGQQITLHAANTLTARLTQDLGRNVKTGIEGLDYTFPTVRDFINLGESAHKQLGKLGISAARSSCIQQLARSLDEGTIHLEQIVSPECEIEKLQSIRGIGNWTAQYIAMRVMNWTDAFLETDVGVRRALPGYTPKDLLKLAEKWRPWRSYAVINLWLKGK